MATGTVNQGPWPQGTVVGAYPASAFVAGQDQPSGAALTTATAGATGSLSFAGLSEGGRYRAWVAGYPPVSFTVVTPAAPQFGDRHRIETLEALADSVDSGLAKRRASTWVNAKELGAIADGTSHPLSESFSTLAAAQVMYPLATGLGQEVDFAAAQEALRLVTALPNGGVAYAGEGTYVMSPLTYDVVGKPVSLRGDEDATVFQYGSDLGNGKWALGPAYPNGFPTVTLTDPDPPIKVRGINFVGPDGTTAPAPGAFPNHDAPTTLMGGLRLERWAEAHDCRVEGFFSGIEFYGNHQKAWNCDVRNNHHNYLWPSIPLGDPMAGGTQYGHQQVLGGSAMRARCANFTVGDANGMLNVVIDGVQMGFAPVNFYRLSAPNGGVWMESCEIKRSNLESIGCAHFLCTDRNSTVDLIRACLFTELGVSLGTPGPDATAPSRSYQNAYKNDLPQDYAIDVGTFDKCRFETGCQFFANPGILGVCRTKTQPTNCTWTEAGDMIDSIASPGGNTGTYGTGRPIFTVTSMSTASLRGTNVIHAKGNLYRIAVAQEAIAIGELTQAQTSAPVNNVLRCTSGVPTGWAAEAAASAGRCILVQTEGTVSQVPTTGVVSTGAWVKPDTANAGKVIIDSTPTVNKVAWTLAGNNGVSGNPIDIRLRGLE